LFLNEPYGAYYHRDIPKEDEELTRVGAGTPGGEYFRRFWLPVELSEELTDLPKAIKVLGEELVLFRDKRGRVGLLELHCSHRGTSLEFGLIEEQGIRCCYHGWMFGVDGKILDTPGEPLDSTYKERLCHGAYLVKEYKGMVWAYMGPPEKTPPFPMFDYFETPGFRIEVRPKNVFHCNWLQVEDNIMDPVHTWYLHTRASGTQFTLSFGELPVMDFLESPIGMVYIATRRVGDNVWVRINDSVPPAVHFFNRNEENGKTEHVFWPCQNMEWSVPIDDHNTLQLAFTRVPNSQPRLDKQEMLRLMYELGQTPDRPYEVRQRCPSDYEALTGQRPIAVHAMEHLADTDRGVIMLRRLVRDGIRAVQRDEDPGIISNPDLKAGRPIRIYSSDTVMKIIPALTTEGDKRLLRETGLRVARSYFNEHPATKGQVVTVEEVERAVSTA
jgi:phenylpropionate dioxygenase-like ring-hydroxylating dioxygenase large terminal subunit